MEVQVAAPKNTRRRILGALFQAFAWALLMVMIGIAALALGANSKDFALFGYREYTVLTRSMEPALPVQCVVFVKETDPNQIHIGDIITFVQKDGRVITHRVLNRIENYKQPGQIAFRTKGDANPSADNETVLASNVRGVVRLHINELGYIFYYISNHLLLVFVIYGSLLGAFIFWRRARRDVRTSQQQNAPNNAPQNIQPQPQNFQPQQSPGVAGEYQGAQQNAGVQQNAGDFGMQTADYESSAPFYAPEQMQHFAENEPPRFAQTTDFTQPQTAQFGQFDAHQNAQWPQLNTPENAPYSQQNAQNVHPQDSSQNFSAQQMEPGLN
jgi:signal peptidase